jgi:predicted NBD/HSP70 family sugar kinase
MNITYIRTYPLYIILYEFMVGGRSRGESDVTSTQISFGIEGGITADNRHFRAGKAVAEISAIQIPINNPQKPALPGSGYSSPEPAAVLWIS